MDTRELAMRVAQSTLLEGAFEGLHKTVEDEETRKTLKLAFFAGGLAVLDIVKRATTLRGGEMLMQSLDAELERYHDSVVEAGRAAQAKAEAEATVAAPDDPLPLGDAYRRAQGKTCDTCSCWSVMLAHSTGPGPTVAACLNPQAPRNKTITQQDTWPSANDTCAFWTDKPCMEISR